MGAPFIVPAVLTMTSTVPKVDAALLNRASTLESDVMSAVTART